MEKKSVGCRWFSYQFMPLSALPQLELRGAQGLPASGDNTSWGPGQPMDTNGKQNWERCVGMGLWWHH